MLFTAFNIKHQHHSTAVNKWGARGYWATGKCLGEETNPFPFEISKIGVHTAKAKREGGVGVGRKEVCVGDCEGQWIDTSHLESRHVELTL